MIDGCLTIRGPRCRSLFGKMNGPPLLARSTSWSRDLFFDSPLCAELVAWPVEISQLAGHGSDRYVSAHSALRFQEVAHSNQVGD